MNIILPKFSQKNNINFHANLNSPHLKFSPKDFYVNISGYGKNEKWADIIIKTADLGASLIQRETSGENVLKIITAGVKRANKADLNIEKAELSGILRVNRSGWLSEIADVITPYKNNRYQKYGKRLDKISKAPLKAPEQNLAMTTAENNFPYPRLIHGDPLYINHSIDYVLKKFSTLFPKYLTEEVKPENLNEINNTIAEIRWVLAHATPWLRGSDSISNVFIRAIYKALGIKTSPLTKGISLDLEAYCTPLEQYKQNFITYFEKAPQIVK